MAPRPIVFALANPDPEIDPDLAAPHAAVVATGRSDYPNQINNVLCFPGFFRGMLDVRACRVVDAMKIAAAGAIAGVIAEGDLTPDYIVPSVFDRRVATAVAKAVSHAAVEAGRRTSGAQAVVPHFAVRPRSPLPPGEGRVRAPQRRLNGIRAISVRDRRLDAVPEGGDCRIGDVSAGRGSPAMPF